MRRTIANRAMLTLLATAAFSPMAAHAQQATDPVAEPAPASAESGQVEGSVQLEEIVVTAQKRSENLHDVPISVSAITGEALIDSGVRRLEDVQFKVPNFTLAENPIGTTISIRGIFSGSNQGFEQSVGIYVDGIHYGRAQQARAPFLDIERVEVLRGPQPILFGKNAIAGALNIITAAPKGRFGGYVQGSYSPNHDELETSAAIWGPITDSIKFRLAGRYHKADGHIDNVTLGRSEAQRDDWQLRGTIDADVTDRLSFTLKAEAGSFDVKGREQETLGDNSSTSTSPLFAGLSYGQILTNTGTVPVNSRIAALNAATGMQLLSLPPADASVLDMTRDGKRHSNGDESNNKAQTLLFKANYELDGGTLTAISGFSHFKYDEECDCDMTGAQLFNAGLQEEYSQFSQEVRFVSEKGGALDYIVGGFFQASEDEYADQIRVPANSLLVPLVYNQAYAPAYQAAFAGWLAGHPGDIPGAIGAGRAAGSQAGAVGMAAANTQAARNAKVNAKIWSIFGQATWNFSDELRLTFGSRLNYEKKKGRRDMEIVGIDGAPLTGQQALLAPIAYANVLGITSSNLNSIAAAGIPGLSALATAAIARLGDLPVEGELSKWRYTPSLTLQYEPSDRVMLYASWVKGAKSGGFDYRANNKGAAATTADAFEFADEKATSYEAGSKIRFLGGRAELNTSIYYTDYQDLQISVFDGTLGFNVGNAAKARVYGLEADARMALTRNLTARASIALTDFKFKDYKDGQCYPGQADDITNPALGLCDFSGKTSQFVADTVGTLALEYRGKLTSDLEFTASADMFYTSKYYAAATLDPALVQDAYAKINARVGIASDASGWEIAVLGKNLTDREPLTFAAATPLAYSVFGAVSNFGIFGEGRTFALQGRMKF